MSDISGYILIGGTSSRMGRPKHLISFGGESLLERAVRELGQVCAPVAVIGSGVEPIEGIRHIADDVSISDSVSGPLVGLYTALSDSKTEWTAIVACDMPFVTAGLISFLAELADGSVDAVVPVQADGWPQPLCSLYKRSVCLPVSEKLVAEGRRGPRALLEHVRVRRVEFSELRQLTGSDSFFLNVNTPADLELAVRISGSEA